MQTRQLKIKRSDLREVLLPVLRGRVFHVTTPTGLEGILASGQIDSNLDRRRRFTYPQSENNWGRQQGYVCLFDLRDVSEENLDDSLDKFYFLHPAKADPVFLFVDSAEYAKLIPCWYPGDLPISVISEALTITLEPDDAESLMRAALRKARDPELWSGGATLEGKTLKELQRRVKEVAAVAESNGFTITKGWDRSRVWKEGTNYRIGIRLERPEKMR
jgi:hypothetical protein